MLIPTKNPVSCVRVALNGTSRSGKTNSELQIKIGLTINNDIAIVADTLKNQQLRYLVRKSLSGLNFKCFEGVVFSLYKPLNYLSKANKRSFICKNLSRFEQVNKLLQV